MLPALLGLSLTTMIAWSGPAPAAVPDSTPSAGAPAESAAEPTPPTLPASPDAATAESPAPGSAPAPVSPPQPEPAGPAPELDPGPTVQPPFNGPEPTATPAPTVTPATPMSELDVAPSLPEPGLRDYVAIRPPSWKGTGLLVAAGLTFATAITFQGIDTLACGECATGGIERGFMATTIGLAAGGGAVRAHADAYDDTALRRNRPNTRRALITGALLTGAGAVLGLVNEGMWWRCVFEGDGPYEREPQGEFDFANFNCRYGLSRGLMDLATGATATGAAMLTWSLVYRRDARAYQRARVIGLRPTFGRDRFGFGIEGRF